MTGIGISLGVLAFALVLRCRVSRQIVDGHASWRLNQSSATFFHTRKSPFTRATAKDNIAVACCHIAWLDGLRRGN